MKQQGQVFELKTRSHGGEAVWAYRYRIAGRGSRRLQRGGFKSEPSASTRTRACRTLTSSPFTTRERRSERVTVAASAPESRSKAGTPGTERGRGNPARTRLF
jgi:hypothetical protein